MNCFSTKPWAKQTIYETAGYVGNRGRKPRAQTTHTETRICQQKQNAWHGWNGSLDSSQRNETNTNKGTVWFRIKQIVWKIMFFNTHASSAFHTKQCTGFSYKDTRDDEDEYESLACMKKRLNESNKGCYRSWSHSGCLTLRQKMSLFKSLTTVLLPFVHTIKSNYPILFDFVVLFYISTNLIKNPPFMK